jgi:hypothetical protein
VDTTPGLKKDLALGLIRIRHAIPDKRNSLVLLVGFSFTTERKSFLLLIFFAILLF